MVLEDEAKDEKVMAKVMLKTAKSKPVCRTGMAVEKEKTEEVDQVILMLNVISVARLVT